MAHEDLCTERPQWLIVEAGRNATAQMQPAPGCTLLYERVETTRPSGLSGLSWTLYKRHG